VSTARDDLLDEVRPAAFAIASIARRVTTVETYAGEVGDMREFFKRRDG
jgi:hypothetical protein